MGTGPVSLEERMQEVASGKRESIVRMTFLGAVGRDRITILNFNKEKMTFIYRRSFPKCDETYVSADMSRLGNLANYIDIETLRQEDLQIFLS